MIAVASLVCLIGIFVAGQIFEIHTLLGLGMLGFFCLCMGVLIAAAETRGFEGCRVGNIPKPITWEKLWLSVTRLALDRGQVLSTEQLYVHTRTGILPVTGIFTARMNHALSLVLDTTEGDPHETFNALKQGCM